ncbi:MAG TPA: YciI family protein [Pseudonocardiaceae bacterium]|nr:YciI family protein [Pseudonocardiaceae bacterium]
MKYVILIHSNPTTRHVWEGLTDEQRRQFGQAHLDFGQHLIDTGQLVAAEGLADIDQARFVSVTGDETLVTDGPFAEVKEYLAGFYVVECATIDDATALAATLPDARNTHVEVRPVLNLR